MAWPKGVSRAEWAERQNEPEGGEKPISDLLPPDLSQKRPTYGELMELLAWIAPRIVRRNANWERSDKMCLLCVMGIPEYKRLPCRHGEIFRFLPPSDPKNAA